MAFALKFTEQAEADLDSLEKDPGLLKRFKAVRKALGYLETNPRHPGLNTHKFSALRGFDGGISLSYQPFFVTPPEPDDKMA